MPARRTCRKRRPLWSCSRVVCRDPDTRDTCRRYWQNHHARLHRGDGRLREARRGGRHGAESLIQGNIGTPKMQEIVKKKAPVQATAGAGFRYEDAVAARFLLDLLGGTNALGVDFGRITRIDWQARDSGWLADDLVITCRDSAGD